MNDFEDSKTPAAGPLEMEELSRRCAGLEWQTTVSLAALVVLSCALCVFIGIQWKQARSELANIKPTATRIIQGYLREKPDIDARLARLGEYGRTHPDFAPILNRYGIPIPPAAAPAAPAVVPKPAPAPKK